MKKSRFITMLIFVLLGIILFLVGFLVKSCAVNDDHKVDTTAVITKVEEQYDASSGEKSHEVYVSYDVDGESHEAKLPVYKMGYRAGKEIKIYYMDNDLDTVGVRGMENLPMLILCGVGVLFVVIGFIILFKRPKKQPEPVPVTPEPAGEAK